MTTVWQKKTVKKGGGEGKNKKKINDNKWGKIGQKKQSSYIFVAKKSWTLFFGGGLLITISFLLLFFCKKIDSFVCLFLLFKKWGRTNNVWWQRRGRQQSHCGISWRSLCSCRKFHWQKAAHDHRSQ